MKVPSVHATTTVKRLLPRFSLLLQVLISSRVTTVASAWVFRGARTVLYVPAPVIAMLFSHNAERLQKAEIFFVFVVAGAAYCVGIHLLCLSSRRLL